ncbi:hypothetical protein GGX14DRAFT_507235 [Mycena pura]|uniref:G-protein coupled receptors family 2 profile 2 domain-containing protein n=1 Tax=Mycena pura TaxID=153505 RepID=A0AAD6US52_9AGAR|nr:hypothetical protein GGX14DRAFT_547130 [Mycena pura]KAJ7190467.1 hypothetical protein GGX14DRAFT_507235 [Mycena pura]
MDKIRQATPGDSVLSRAIILGLMIPGFVLTVALLALYGYAAWNPTSRPHLNRVSFRLLVYALLAHLVFCIAFTVGTLEGTLGQALCDSIAFFTTISLTFSAGMFFCVALNLPLVLVYKVNGRRMEKYYILGTTVVCIICAVVPLAFGRLGLDTNDMTCWFKNEDHRLEWVLGTQTILVLLTSTGEVLSFLTILRYVVTYEFETRRFRRMAAKSSTGSGTFATTTASQTSPVGSTISMFRNIIIRIGLYPLVSCLLNISASLLDLHVIQSPEPTELVRLSAPSQHAHNHTPLPSRRPISLLRTPTHLRPPRGH